MTEASVSFAGNPTDQPELRHTEGGIARAVFRVAVSGRWEQEAALFTVIVWRDQAKHAAQSLAKGSRIVVVGRLQLGIWLVATGMNYLPLAISAQSLSRPGALEAELVDADLPRELQQAGTRQLWILVPLAVVIAAVAQAWSHRRQRHEHRNDSTNGPVR